MSLKNNICISILCILPRNIHVYLSHVYFPRNRPLKNTYLFFHKTNSRKKHILKFRQFPENIFNIHQFPEEIHIGCPGSIRGGLLERHAWAWDHGHPKDLGPYPGRLTSVDQSKLSLPSVPSGYDEEALSIVPTLLLQSMMYSSA